MNSYRIGRSPQNDIVLDYPHVSGFHADIMVNRDNTITITDHSTNGTMANGMLYKNQTFTARIGDDVRFAGVELPWSKLGISRKTVDINSNRTVNMPNEHNYQQPRAQLYQSPNQEYSSPHKPIQINVNPYSPQPQKKYLPAPYKGVAMTMAILSIFTGWLAFIFAILGIVFANNGLRKVSQAPSDIEYYGVGSLRTARAISIVMLVLFVIGTVILIILGATGGI